MVGEVPVWTAARDRWKRADRGRGVRRRARTHPGERSTVQEALRRGHRAGQPHLGRIIGAMRATTPDWREFSIRLLNAAGVASLGAGVIFFVAANWQDYG